MDAREASQAIVQANRAGRAFGGRFVLADIDLSVGRGEIFGVVGPDGSGKTTLMQMLAAILDPTEGSCRVLGFDTVREAAQVTARVGYMSQGFTLYDRLTVDENLAFAARIRGVDRNAFEVRRRALLRMAGLLPFGARRAGQLSGGMRKKLALCTNLIHEPPLLLLDELSLGVDPLSRRELWRMLRGYRAQGSTIVLTTPYMDEAEHCDRLAFLHSGRVLAVDTPASLRQGARGLVYELRTAQVAAAGRPIAASESIAAVQWWADRLRFQLRPRAPFPAALRAALASLGELVEVKPDLENAFVAMAGGDRSPAGWSAASRPALGARKADAVHLEDVTVRFGTFTAVDRVSVRIAAGEVIGWLGPNGAGKTTLIRVLCGLQRPVSGQVTVAGMDVLRAGSLVKGRIGYMSQRFSLYPDLTAMENLAFFAGAYGLTGAARHEPIAWAVSMADLPKDESRRAGELSGAVRQRLALACAIVHRPAVLFLDEPTSGVDPMARQRFWSVIRVLADSGMAVLVTTHYLEEARYCHRLGLMARGRLIALGSMAELQKGLGPAEAGLDGDMEAVFLAYLARDDPAGLGPGP